MSSVQMSVGRLSSPLRKHSEFSLKNVIERTPTLRRRCAPKPKERSVERARTGLVLRNRSPILGSMEHSSKSASGLDRVKMNRAWLYSDLLYSRCINAISPNTPSSAYFNLGKSFFAQEQQLVNIQTWLITIHSPMRSSRIPHTEGTCPSSAQEHKKTTNVSNSPSDFAHDMSPFQPIHAPVQVNVVNRVVVALGQHQLSRHPASPHQRARPQQKTKQYTRVDICLTRQQIMRLQHSMHDRGTPSRHLVHRNVPRLVPLVRRVRQKQQITTVKRGFHRST